MNTLLCLLKSHQFFIHRSIAYREPYKLSTWFAPFTLPKPWPPRCHATQLRTIWCCIELLSDAKCWNKSWKKNRGNLVTMMAWMTWHSVTEPQHKQFIKWFLLLLLLDSIFRLLTWYRESTLTLSSMCKWSRFAED